jgi:hypothetical protein
MVESALLPQLNGTSSLRLECGLELRCKLNSPTSNDALGSAAGDGTGSSRRLAVAERVIFSTAIAEAGELRTPTRQPAAEIQSSIPHLRWPTPGQPDQPVDPGIYFPSIGVRAPAYPTLVAPLGVSGLARSIDRGLVPWVERGRPMYSNLRRPAIAEALGQAAVGRGSRSSVARMV